MALQQAKVTANNQQWPVKDTSLPNTGYIRLLLFFNVYFPFSTSSAAVSDLLE